MREAPLSKQRVYGGVCILVFSLLAVSCSSTATQSGGENQTGFTMALTSVPTTVDPAVFEGQQSQDAYFGTASTLVRLEGRDPEALTAPGATDVQPELAESWEQDGDGSYTFTLREAKSPFGNTATSEDVKWSFERAMALSPVTVSILERGNIDTKNPIQIIDSRTVRVNVVKPSIFTLGVLTWYGATVLDSVEAKKHATDEDSWAEEWLQSSSATFGPYQVASINPGEEVRLVRNRNYWGNADLDSVVLRAVPDAGTRLLLIKAGDVDFTSRLPFNQLSEVTQQESLELIEVPGLAPDSLSLNIRVKPFSSTDVRRAIAMAIDREALVNGAYGGFGQPAFHVIAESIQQPDPPANPYTTFDPEAAKTLLAQAGYPDGFEFTLIFNTGRVGAAAEIAPLLKSQLEKIGVTVNLEPIASSPDFQESIDSQKQEAWLFFGPPLLPDPGYGIDLLYTCDSIAREGYCNPEVDRLADRMAETEPGPERDAYISESQKLLDEELPFVPLVEPIIPWVVRTERIAGVDEQPVLGIYFQDLKAIRD